MKPMNYFMVQMFILEQFCDKLAFLGNYEDTRSKLEVM